MLSQGWPVGYLQAEIKGSCEPTREYEMLTITQYGGFSLEIKCNDFWPTQKKKKKGKKNRNFQLDKKKEKKVPHWVKFKLTPSGSHRLPSSSQCAPKDLDN